MTPVITDQKELRKTFWETHPELTRRPGKDQNSYPADTRAAWVCFVDAQQRSGAIPDALAQRAVL